MITAELNHNPYLLLTTVRFNGQLPRINSQVERYESVMLKDWIHKVPGIYPDEMNGYDFDLYFTGTKSDYESLQKAFADKGISEDDVRFFIKMSWKTLKRKAVPSMICCSGFVRIGTASSILRHSMRSIRSILKVRIRMSSSTAPQMFRSIPRSVRSVSATQQSLRTRC